MVMMTTGVELCPVCHGKAFVPAGFYAPTGWGWDLPSTWIEKCRSCNGKGYIVIPSLPTYGVPKTTAGNP